jgi:hypothetical protein
VFLDSFNIPSDWILQTQAHVPVHPKNCSIRLIRSYAKDLNATINLCFKRGDCLEIGENENVVYVQGKWQFNLVDVTTCSIEHILSSAATVYPSSVDFVNLNLDLEVLAELRVPIWLRNCTIEGSVRDGEVLGKVFCMLNFDDEEVNVRIEGGKVQY